MYLIFTHKLFIFKLQEKLSEKLNAVIQRRRENVEKWRLQHKKPGDDANSAAGEMPVQPLDEEKPEDADKPHWDLGEDYELEEDDPEDQLPSSASAAEEASNKIGETSTKEDSNGNGFDFI